MKAALVYAVLVGLLWRTSALEKGGIRRVALEKILAAAALVESAGSVNVRESEIEQHLKWHVQMLGGKAYKWTSPGLRGVADRVVCLPGGQVWFVELKAPRGRLSELQKLFAADMARLKQPYVVLWSKEMVDEWAKARRLG